MRPATRGTKRRPSFLLFFFSFVPTWRNSSRGLDFNANILSTVAVVVVVSLMPESLNPGDVTFSYYDNASSAKFHDIFKEAK